MPTDTNSPGASSLDPPEPRRRQVSARRREQNRIAQKTYRQKRKEYLQQLEKIVKETEFAPTQLHSGSNLPRRPRCQEGGHHVDNGSASIPRSRTPCSPLEQPASSDHSLRHETADELEMSKNLAQLPLFNSLGFDLVDEVQSYTNIFDGNETNPRLVDPTLMLDLDGDSLSPRRLSYLREAIRETTKTTLQRSSEESEKIKQNADRIPFSSSTLSTVMKSEPGVIEKYSLEDILTAGILAISKTEKRPESGGGGNGISESPQNVAEKEPDAVELRMPDIHMNTIHLTTMSFLTACLTNAAMLGLSPEALWDKTMQSPFYLARIADEQVGTSDAVHFSHLKSLLQPSSTQLNYPHHPYIDILPFPAFRNRIIQLLQIRPLPFDPGQLCCDLKSDGIVCWGSVRTGERDAIGTGSPWDSRSWELKPWFLKKWWILFDGPDDEIYQNSRWWCELRSEESSYPW